jgi:predicted outer membrane repeat protein
MAVRNRHFTLAAVALPFLFLVMAGSARAITVPIVVNTLDGFSETVPGACSLTDAVAAANTGGTVNNCTGGSGANDIEFSVTGTINLTATLDVTTTGALSINGPAVGGITISGRTTNEILDLESDTNVTLTNLTFLDGGNAIDGGAIFADGTSLTIENSTFSHNAAGFGGAILADAGTITITNSTFAGNSAVEEGGAIYNDGATVLLTNDTFDGNTAGSDGGSLFSADPVTKYKSTLFANGSPNNCAASAGADHKDIGFNISDDTSCAFSMSTSKVENPGLSSAGLAQNGGPTETIALVSGANAIGHDTDCTDQESTPEPVVTDQRLFARPDSPSKCDSGAYEFDAVAPIELVTGSERLQLVSSSTPMSDYINTAFTFIDNGPGSPGPACDSGNNALNGIFVDLFAGSCSDLPSLGLFATIPFMVTTVNHQSYGIAYGSVADGNISGRIVQLPPPAGSCGEWTLNLELSALDLATFGLNVPGPFALIVQDRDGNQGCFDITNAIVGGKINPPTRSVRRGVRR